MPELYSSNKAMAGMFRANVVEVRYVGTTTYYSLYIPALHKDEIPFPNLENLHELIKADPATGEIIKHDGDLLNMNLRDYPIAQSCEWGVRADRQQGDCVWVMFENGDADFPVIMGNIGTAVPMMAVKPGGINVGNNSFFNPNATIYGNTNRDIIFNALISAGVSIAGASGILSNIFYESTFRPNALGDNGTSFGICQWHKGRWDRLKEWCNTNNLSWESLEGQIQYLIWELQTHYNDSWRELVNAPNTVAGTERACAYITIRFEIPAGAGTLTNYGPTTLMRLPLAVEYFNEYMQRVNSGGAGILTLPSFGNINAPTWYMTRFATNSDGFRQNGNISGPRGLVLHSTAWPGGDAETIFNYFNAPGRGASIHGVIDTNRFIQMMPFTQRAGHVGSGRNGSLNNSFLGFEVCEPSGIKYNSNMSTIIDYNPPAGYFRNIIDRTIHLYAYLCSQFSINPLQKDSNGGILGHYEAHALGWGSNHGDPRHWWESCENYTMDHFRQAVYNYMMR